MACYAVSLCGIAFCLRSWCQHYWWWFGFACAGLGEAQTVVRAVHKLLGKMILCTPGNMFPEFEQAWLLPRYLPQNRTLQLAPDGVWWWLAWQLCMASASMPLSPCRWIQLLRGSVCFFGLEALPTWRCGTVLSSSTVQTPQWTSLPLWKQGFGQCKLRDHRCCSLRTVAGM